MNDRDYIDARLLAIQYVLSEIVDRVGVDADCESDFRSIMNDVMNRRYDGWDQERTREVLDLAYSNLRTILYGRS